MTATPHDDRAPSLTDFLLARIAEDEAMARGGSKGPWVVWQTLGQDALVEGADGVPVAYCGDDHAGWFDMADARHVIRHDPARVLAECEAKRRIVDEHEARWISPENWWACNTCGTPGEYDVMSPCPTLRLLALPYVEHPDYREEWKP